ncbi:MAG TPA: sigma-70 family RNA polymerase sigma factor [candidate division Zixibacteria bacterium]|nr:sigma-70 family RNA polymerase sigma factor [candidate division Zixibacteria bacterium]
MTERPLSAFVVQALSNADRLRHRDRLVEAEPEAAVAPATIDELAAAAAEGSTEAVARLYDALVGPIYRYVAVRVRRREDAEDLTQQVFERIVTGLPRYRPRGRPFEAWAFRIARNAVIDHLRRHRVHDPYEAIHDAVDGDGVEAFSLRAEEIEELRRAIATLTPDQQEALALRFAAGLSAKEAAQVMGRRAGTIRGLTHRAINALRRRMTAPETPQPARRRRR